MKNINLEQIYYKVENKDSDLFKRANKFLAMEENLREIQKKTIESQLPKFSKYKGEKSFNRIVQYTGLSLMIKKALTLKYGKQKKKMG